MNSDAGGFGARGMSSQGAGAQAILQQGRHHRAVANRVLHFSAYVLIANEMRRIVYLVAGWAAVILGLIGAVLPLLPTVPFMILAAFCFARSSPRLEAWLVNHPVFGAHIRNWRQHGAINKRAKRLALLAFCASATLGLIFLAFPLSLIPLGAALIGGTWVWRRPDA